MSNAFDSSIPQFAVIEARRTDGSSERFVLAYSDENALRDLIAGPSIIGCGFASRAQAQGHADVRLGSEHPEGPRTTGVEIRDYRILSAKQRLRVAFDLMEAGRIIHGFLKAATAAVILTLYSRHSVLAWRGHFLEHSFAFLREERPLAHAVARSTPL